MTDIIQLFLTIYQLYVLNKKQNIFWVNIYLFHAQEAKKYMAH